MFEDFDLKALSKLLTENILYGFLNKYVNIILFIIKIHFYIYISFIFIRIIHKIL
jgi:hypothetical protein